MATMTKAPDEYLKEPYARILVPAEEGGFSAEILEFPGCFAEGETPEEALRNLEAAARSWVQAALDQGQEIPGPSSSQGFSGKLALRLPRGLHKQAVRMATRDGVSLNQFLLSAIAARVGAEDLYERLARRSSAGRSTFVFAAFGTPDMPTVQALNLGQPRVLRLTGGRGKSVVTAPSLTSRKAIAGATAR